MAVHIIKIAGRARRAYVEGETIYRDEVIYVPSERTVFRTIDTDNHFVYRRAKGTFGSTLMCTCGGISGIFNYDAYSRFQSANMGKIICCVNHMQTGYHADGST